MKNIFKKSLVCLLVFSLLGLPVLPVAEAEAAAVSLVKGGSFEGDVKEAWGFWQATNDSRQYDYYRAYDSPVGQGSYCAAIDAQGEVGDAFSAILSSKAANNSFSVDSSKKYYLVFYARATVASEVITYFQKSSDYSPLSGFEARMIGTSWQKYLIGLTPNESSQALLAFVVGKMPAGATLYLDGVQLINSDNVITTKSISGKIGDKNKVLGITNVSNYDETDVTIELPYNKPDASGVSTLKIHPRGIIGSTINFDLLEGTFSGIGRVYISDIFIGQFDYNIQPTITGFHPSVIRLDEDLIVYGNGFSPLDGASQLVAERLNASGQKENLWIKPLSFDPALKELRFRLPAGAVNGKLMIQNSFTNVDGMETTIRSNQLAYKLKPVITSTGWSQRGYEHVGDKLRISGLGFGKTPTVNFYSQDGRLIESIKATNVETGALEIIEVTTTKKENLFEINIVADGVASDRSSALSYLAKPVLSNIKAKASRTVSSSGEIIPAARVGETISLTGISLSSASGESSVSFQGIGQRLTVDLTKETNTKATGLSVQVPVGAVNGYIGVRVNGADSNYLPLEIIPDIVSITPEPVVPGQEMSIRAVGMGTVTNLTRIIFNSGKVNEKIVVPDTVVPEGNEVIIKLVAPYEAAASRAGINVQYDHWTDVGKEVLTVAPTIVRAGIDMDTRILSIVGYGLSLTNSANKLSFEYADANQTAIKPKIKMLGVYPSEEGQEIRVQILDNYHYGQVRVTVDGRESNEVSFGPASISKISRRVEYVKSSGTTMGVLYISGYNFGPKGGVKVGDRWAEVHYRSNFFIIAVVPPAELNNGPVIVARE
jgi:hypothetical protein